MKIDILDVLNRHLGATIEQMKIQELKFFKAAQNVKDGIDLSEEELNILMSYQMEGHRLCGQADGIKLAIETLKTCAVDLSNTPMQ